MNWLKYFKKIKLKYLLLFVLWSLLVFIIVAPLLNKVIDEFTHGLYEKKASRVIKAIESEKAYLLSQTKALIDSHILDKYYETRDILGLLPVLSAEIEDRHLGKAVAIGKDGSVLTRTKDLGRRGDYVFTTTTWGRAMAKGEYFASVEHGRSTPFILLAGGPIYNQAGDFLGALGIAYDINDEYAFKLKSKLTDNDLEFLFYSLREGIMASTFADEEINRNLISYFNTGSEWLQSGLSDKILKIGLENYYLKNFRFSGLEGSQGGVMVLFPSRHYLRSILFSSFLTFIFLYGVLFYLRLPRKKGRLSLAIFTLLLLICSYLYNSIILERGIFQVKKSAFSIYNSELALEPEFDILSTTFPHRVAIKLSTGGEAVNTVSAIINYDPEMVSVEDIYFTNSFCEPNLIISQEINVLAGQVSVACLVPSPGYVNLGTLAEILIRPKREGQIDLTFAQQSKILANDGLGTNVLRQAVGGTFYAYGDEYDKTVVLSSSHPNSERWYGSNSVRFVWISDESNASHHYVFSDQAYYNPSWVVQEIRESSVMLEAEKSGQYYFYLITNKGQANERINRYQVKVDVTPPQKPVVKASQAIVPPGEVVRVEFTSYDLHSSLQENFYVKVDDGTFLPLKSPLFVSFVEEGGHNITIRAFDEAGNYSDESIKIQVTGLSFFKKVIYYIIGRRS